MKISKSLLSAIATGILMTTTYSCEKTENCGDNVHSENCADNCEIDHCEPWNCPACGMG